MRRDVVVAVMTARVGGGKGGRVKKLLLLLLVLPLAALLWLSRGVHLNILYGYV